MTLVLGIAGFWLGFARWRSRWSGCSATRSSPGSNGVTIPPRWRRRGRCRSCGRWRWARGRSRLIGYNLLATPLYLMTFATGIGLPIAFLAVNGWLLGRDLGDMVAARHLASSELAHWRARTRGTRFLAGLAVSGLFVVPGLNLLAPVVGAAAMTHLFHRGRRA